VSPIEPLQQRKLSIAVAAQLEELVMKGEYREGDKLPPERVLVDEFGVSRSTIREALRRLEAEGLVRIDHGVGAFVCERHEAENPLVSLLVLDQSTVPELFEARRALESTTAALAAERLSPAAASELESLASQLADEALSPAAYVELDVALHQAIARATKNRVLMELAESLREAHVEYSRRVIDLQERRRRATHGHRAIVDAILARDPARAREAMIAHLDEAEQDLLQAIDQPKDKRNAPKRVALDPAETKGHPE
jgi:GntR family transcriptional regulator, transcriptional repressor for pyruvate dehydrogenase complex